MPTAGSLPKKSLVHRPVPLNVFEIQASLAPYRTVAELLSVNHWPSTATVVRVAEPLATRQDLTMPTAGSVLKNSLVQRPSPLT